MNRLVRRVSIALASTVMAGGALLGAGGSASATASKPVEHTQSSIGAFGTDGGRDGYRSHGYGSGYRGERDDGRGGHRGWYTDNDRRGRHHVRHHHRKWEERWDGRHLYVWDGDRWVEVTSWRGIGVDRWHPNQLVPVQR
ncbi:hypothetical protein ACWGN9_26815 [Streptomyces sp. NPDC055775]